MLRSQNLIQIQLIPQMLLYIPLFSCALALLPLDVCHCSRNWKHPWRSLMLHIYDTISISTYFPVYQVFILVVQVQNQGLSLDLFK